MHLRELPEVAVVEAQATDGWQQGRQLRRQLKVVDLWATATALLLLLLLLLALLVVAALIPLTPRTALSIAVVVPIPAQLRDQV